MQQKVVFSCHKKPDSAKSLDRTLKGPRSKPDRSQYENVDGSSLHGRQSSDCARLPGRLQRPRGNRGQTASWPGMPTGCGEGSECNLIMHKPRDLFILPLPRLDGQTFVIHFMYITRRLHVAQDVIL